jgi:hypothetical protein
MKQIVLKKNSKLHNRNVKFSNVALIIRNKLSSYVKNAKSFYVLFACLFILITASKLMSNQIKKFLKTVSSLYSLAWQQFN